MFEDVGHSTDARKLRDTYLIGELQDVRLIPLPFRIVHVFEYILIKCALLVLLFALSLPLVGQKTEGQEGVHDFGHVLVVSTNSPRCFYSLAK